MTPDVWQSGGRGRAGYRRPLPDDPRGREQKPQGDPRVERVGHPQPEARPRNVRPAGRFDPDDDEHDQRHREADACEGPPARLREGKGPDHNVPARQHEPGGHEHRAEDRVVRVRVPHHSQKSADNQRARDCRLCRVAFRGHEEQRKSPRREHIQMSVQPDGEKRRATKSDTRETRREVIVCQRPGRAIGTSAVEKDRDEQGDVVRGHWRRGEQRGGARHERGEGMQRQTGAEGREQGGRFEDPFRSVESRAGPPDVPDWTHIVAGAGADHPAAHVSGQRPGKRDGQQGETGEDCSVPGGGMQRVLGPGHQLRMRDTHASAKPAPASCSQRSARSRRNSKPSPAKAAAIDRKYQ